MDKTTVKKEEGNREQIGCLTETVKKEKPFVFLKV
jgi:hypothetical protein